MFRRSFKDNNVRKLLSYTFNFNKVNVSLPGFLSSFDFHFHYFSVSRRKILRYAIIVATGQRIRKKNQEEIRKEQTVIAIRRTGDGEHSDCRSSLPQV